MRLSSLLIFAFALSLLLAPSTAAADDPMNEHLDDARSLYYAGHWQEADEAFDKAYQVADEGSKIKAATALEWGSLMWEQGRYEGAERLVEQALELARELELDEATGELLVTRGHIEASRGQLSSAENTLNICVQLTGELGDDVHRALCRINRRMVRTLQGKDPGTEEEFRADIDVLASAESALSVGTSLAKTSELYRDNEDFERASELLDRAHQMYREAGSVPAVTRNQLRRAQLLHHQQKFDEARAMTDGLLERFEQMRNRPMIVHTLALQAEDAIHQDNPRRAVSLYRRALTIADEIENPQLTGRVHLALCEMNFADSPQHCRRATDVFSATEMRFLQIRARSALARTQQIQGDFEQARSSFRQAIGELEDAVDTGEGPYAVSRTFQYANLCQVEAQLRATGGLTTCREALDGIEDLDEQNLERHANLQAATVHAAGRTALQANRAQTALEYLDDARRHYEELGEQNHLRLAADITLRIGAIKAELDERRDDAPDAFRQGLKLTEKLDLDDEEVATIHISLHTQLAQLLRADEQWTQAIDILQDLAEIATGADDAESAAWAYSGLANAYLQTDRRDDALDALETGHPLAEKSGDDDLIKTFEDNLEQLRD